MKRFPLVLVLVSVLIFAAFFNPGQALAQGENPDEPVVYGILLYSNTCPHCHEFITNDWPVMKQEFGDQFQLLFINVNSDAGHILGGAVYDYYGIPEGERYVPMMMIGNQVFVGGYDIPMLGGDAVRQGLASGGIPLPDVPGLQEAYAQALAMAGETASNTGEEPADAAPEASNSSGETQENSSGGIDTQAENVDSGQSIRDMTVADRIKRDLAGNLIAIVVLLGLVASLGTVLVTTASTGEKASGWLEKSPAWAITLIVALAGLFIGVTLVSSTQGEALPTMAALTVLVAYLVISVTIYVARPITSGPRRKLSAFTIPSWLFLVAISAGMVVALYLGYVEAAKVEAVCGAVGDCNTVQQSSYAMLFGFLSVGLLGVIGNVAMLIAWLVGMSGRGMLSDLGWVALFGMAIFGTAFSIYLTFLEPFVIGATCAWCVTSAITMMLILWFSTGRGLQSAQRLLEGQNVKTQPGASAPG
ncbi:MAG: hypothetical protein JXJ17_17920 [Anaerolineae bacterium]|nr:hypothetical protein [Anaerolineae bacterium]